jgi:hypothetical protein
LKKWVPNQDDDEFLTDLLFESNLSLTDIAKELGTNINQLNKRINQLGLSWIKERHKKMSRGQTALTLVMKKLIPGENIINEYHLGDRLKLDVYCPKYNIAAEYHGRQHFFYTQRFFESKYEFEEAQKRDQKKIEKCKELGIVLVVFRYNDKLTEQSVYDRIIEAIRNAEPTQNTAYSKKSVNQNASYIAAKKRNSDNKKAYYKKMKDNKKND